jgi:hypothetical protein
MPATKKPVEASGQPNKLSGFLVCKEGKHLPRSAFSVKEPSAEFIQLLAQILSPTENKKATQPIA